MTGNDFEREKKEAEENLRFAEETFGPDHPMVAARLEYLADLLRTAGKNLLEAANLEARAKVIRSKFNNDELLSGSRGSATDTSAESISTNNALSQYTIISKIGCGGMGVVYKARHDKIDRPLAIKILSSEIINSKPTRKRFEEEIRAACSLSHPHLVSVYDFGVTTKGSPYVVMDFIDGVTLAEEIKGIGAIGQERALSMLIQLCEGIAHAHSKGILHRDIKPSNIMLCENGESRDFVKVVDFGLAKLMPSAGKEGKTMTNTTDVVGSPSYMSPEQCLGEQTDQRSDIYATGCVIYETLTGKPPFSSGNTIKIIFQHINADRKSLLRRFRKFKLHSGMEQIVFRCLEKKPSDRYQSVCDLLSDLRQIQSGQKPKFYLSSKKKEQLLIGTCAAVCMSVLAGVVILSALPKKAPKIREKIEEVIEVRELAEQPVAAKKIVFVPARRFAPSPPPVPVPPSNMPVPQNLTAMSAVTFSGARLSTNSYDEALQRDRSAAQLRERYFAQLRDNGLLHNNSYAQKTMLYTRDPGEPPQISQLRSPIQPIVPQSSAVNNYSNTAGSENQRPSKSYTEYRDEVRREIQKHWTSPITNGNAHLMVLLSFGIDSFGAVTDLKLISSSGDNSLDESTLSAVRFASPFSAPGNLASRTFTARFFQDNVTLY